MSNPTLSSAGDDEYVFIHRLREQIEDMPQFMPETFQATGAATEIQCSRFPIYDGDIYADPGVGATGPLRFAVTVGGFVQQIVDRDRQVLGANTIPLDHGGGGASW